MKKYIALILVTLFIIGCGSRGDKAKRKVKFRGVTESQNYIEVGMDFLAQKDIPSAIRNFDQAIKADPGNVDNYLVLGQVYLRLENYDRAIDTFSAALRAEPFNGEAHYMLATSKAFRGDIDGAIDAAQQSVEIFIKYRQEDKFKRSVALLRSLMQAEGEDGKEGIEGLEGILLETPNSK